MRWSCLLPCFFSFYRELYFACSFPLPTIAAACRYFPEYLYLVGAQPVDLSIGVGISPEIEAVMPEILRRAETVLRDWGFIVADSPAQAQARIRALETRIEALRALAPTDSLTPGLKAQIDELQTAAFRAVAQNLTGYKATHSGEQILY